MAGHQVRKLAGNQYISACTLATSFGPIILCSGYAREGDYGALLRATAVLANNGSIPFVVMADFNASMDEVRTSAEFDILGAVAFHHKMGKPAASQGITERLLILSSVLNPYPHTFKPYAGSWMYLGHLTVALGCTSI